MTAVQQRPAPRRFRARRDWGRGVALLLCIVFALVGLVPLSLGVLVRTEPVRRWAARETTALLARELGVSARYVIAVQAWPMTLELTQVVVDATDGGAPFLEVERIGVRPRVFSLLGGVFDAGDVEIVGPRARLVVEGGALANLRFQTPPASAPSEGGDRVPLSSLAITDAAIDARIDGIAVQVRELDVDASAEEDGAFEVSLRSGGAQVVRRHPYPGRDGEDAVDEDDICRLDVRARVEAGGVLVRRLTLRGAADFDPDPGTAPGCALPDKDWRHVDVRIGALRVTPRAGDLPVIGGRVAATVPAAIAHRFVDLPPATGSVQLELDVDFDGRSRLPRVEGRFGADFPGVDGKVFSERIDARLRIADDAVDVTDLAARWGDGDVHIEHARIEPFAPGLPLEAGPVRIQSIELESLLRDMGVHPRAHVGMEIVRAELPTFGGTLDPLALEGHLDTDVREFAVYDSPTDAPGRKRLVGVHEADLFGSFQVRPKGVWFENFQVHTARSHLTATCGIGFASTVDLDVAEGSELDLSDISPLAGTVPAAGRARVTASMHGGFDGPVLHGAVSIAGFELGGFPIGDVEQATARFTPLILDLTEVRLAKNKSVVRAPTVRIDFETADIALDADIDTRAAPHLDIRDFFEVFHFETDPRFADIGGLASGTAKVRYVLGGKEDRCGGGAVDVRARMAVTEVELFGERYDDGNAEIDFRWDDQAAGDRGMEIDIHAAQLRKGSGSILASGVVSRGAVVRVGAVATGIPLAKLDALGPAGKLFDGSVSAVANVGGTLSRLQMTSDVSISRVRVGAAAMPASRLTVALEPMGAPEKELGRTRCGGVVTAPFDIAEYERDLPAGVFRVSGQLFEGQVVLDDVHMTRQRAEVLSGDVHVEKLDLGKLANLVPQLAFSGTPPSGVLSADLTMRRLAPDSPRTADVSLVLRELDVERAGQRVRLTRPSGAITLARDDLAVPDLELEASTASGLRGSLVAGGTVRKLAAQPDLDLAVRVLPIDLARLSQDIPAISRASGTVDAKLRVTGSPNAPRYAGDARLRNGELAMRGSALSLDAVQVDVEIDAGEVRVTRATANVGSGTLSARGRMPVRGLDVGTAEATVQLRNVKVPVADGVELTADADLEASYRPGATLAGEKTLPDVKGTVALTSFSYTRPIAMSVNLGQLAGRARRTEVEAYDPDDDVVRFQIDVISPKPLRFRNNLVDMQLSVVDPGLTLSGTNQRFGARGMLKIMPESKLTLRSSEFEVREGWVRFDDASRIAPKVDVRAQTEYRRYASSAESASSAAESGTAAASAGATSGQWRINLHAHGDAEDLKVNLTSDPPLGQEDIVLLLTLGMTRAELDSGLASSLGETVGLEALTSLTGADKAVKTVVPLIDEFRFGTGYSSRTGRTEPTVTVGKKITDKVRANVTTGITENREVRSVIEWRMGKRVSVQGSYDNANDVGSSTLGNVGADLRWRLEFE